MSFFQSTDTVKLTDSIPFQIEEFRMDPEGDMIFSDFPIDQALLGRQRDPIIQPLPTDFSFHQSPTQTQPVEIHPETVFYPYQPPSIWSTMNEVIIDPYAAVPDGYARFPRAVMKRRFTTRRTSLTVSVDEHAALSDQLRRTISLE